MKLTRHFEQVLARVGFWFVSTVFAIGLLELGSWAALAAHGWIYSNHARRTQASPAYGQAGWVSDFRKEERSWLKARGMFVPFRLWAAREWHGKYINVDAGEVAIARRTDNPSLTGCGSARPKSVWVFGGSTVFSTGVPDWATMPSYLSRDLNSAGLGCATVTNLGVDGYVTTQEMILLTEKLKEGHHPDIVVFYDGFNDAYTGMYARDPRTAFYGSDEMEARVEGTIRGRLDFLQKSHTFSLVHAIVSRLRPGSFEQAYGQANAVTIVDNYQANMKIVRALSQGYHFAFYGFFQPHLLYGHKPMVPFERDMADAAAAGRGPVDPRPLALVYDEAARRGTNLGAVNLSALFDSVSEAVFLDQAHLGPRGNEIVADAVAKYIEEHPEGGPPPTDKEH